jgi:hypothetical protein
MGMLRPKGTGLNFFLLTEDHLSVLSQACVWQREREKKRKDLIADTYGHGWDYLSSIGVIL